MAEKEQNKYSPKEVIRRVLNFVMPFKWLVLSAIAVNAVFSLFNALTTVLVYPLLDIIFPEGDSEISKVLETTSDNNLLTRLKDDLLDFLGNMITGGGEATVQSLLNISLVIIIVFLLKNTFKYWGAILTVKFEERIVKSIRDTVFNKLTGLSVDFFTKSRQGNLISLITNDINSLNANTVASFTILLRELITLSVFLFLLLGISWQLSIIAFSTSIFSFLIIRFSIKYLRRYAGRVQSAMADYTTTMQETVSGIRVVKAYNAEKAANERFVNDSDFYVRSAIKLKKIISLIPSINEITAISALCVVLYIGGSAVLNGSMEPESLMLFIFTLFSIMSPVNTVVNSISKFQHGMVAGERVFTVLDEIPTIKSGSEKIETFEKELKSENATFSYGEHNVIENASFTLPKGKKIALVGSSGSGKSTMLDLIIRFYDPQNGKITIDGRDIRNLDEKSYRALFGVVAQDTMLFNDTIANNIRYGHPSTMDGVVNAAKQANAYDFIMRLPKGFDTVIGDRGLTLSGGERQRVAIARALVRDPEILIFDEATSALDAESEKTVQHAINESLKNRTAIIVAHRLATIIGSDEILVFDEGRIAERGSHSELIGKNGIYKKLYDIQFQQGD